MSALEDRSSRPAPPGQSATTDQLRRNNLSSVLTLIHHEGALSRADLTRLTGFNRSTIGALVVDLVDLGMVYETMPAKGARAGRPSPIVNASERTVAIAVNPEVDAIHLAVVALGGRVLSQIRLPVERELTVDDVVARSSAAMAEMVAGQAFHVVGIGIAVPGQVRLFDGQVREATHLGWFEEPMARRFTEATGYPAWAANAAILGMRAESVFGAGKGVDDLVYFIGGASGIGGGVVTGGQWMTGAAGYAGEFGHTFVQSDGRPCHCGASGCLEAEVTQESLVAMVGLHADEISELPRALATATDPAVREHIERDLDLLAIAVRNAVNVFNPAVVVIGGFLEALYRARSDDTSDRLVRDAIRSARESVRIVPADLGSKQLMIGSAELVFTNLIADPSGAPTH
ncbi:MAG: XylR family transcriptional regulator [Cryobacterium sp.]|jgi:predicted NBD/HSP70 family sugar kinase|nr:XylR family transcriptional regulator [Cryobacterium sp.]